MTTFRYDTTQSWFKGNTHIHSTASDGRLDFTQLAAMYAGAGYHFLFRTDHWVCSDVQADPATYPLLWLDGVELDGDDDAGVFYHTACLGRFEGFGEDTSYEQALALVRAQGGIAILAHPHWTGNTLDEALKHDFDGVEMYNHVCQWMNGKGFGGVHWSAMLAERPNTLAFAADDTHCNPSDPGWNGGWIVVNAAAGSREALMAGIRGGNYYASTGPDFKTITYDGGSVRVTTSPVKFIRLVGARWQCQKVIAEAGGWLTEAEFEMPEPWRGAYVQLEDAGRGMAWTNPLFVDPSA